MVIASVLLASALLWLKPIMVPLVLAIMLSYVLAPLVDISVQKLRFPKGIAIFFSLIVSFVLIFLTGLMISSSVGTLREKSEEYEEHIKTLSEQSLSWINDNLILRLQELGVDIDISQGSAILDSIPISGLMSSMTNTILDLLSNTFLILIFVIYLLEGREPQKKSSPLMERIEGRIKRYLVIKLLLSIATGVLVGIILALLGIDLAMVFGILAFVLNFIPNIGSLIAIILPLPLVLVDPDFTMTLLILTIALPGAVQMVVGNVIEPKLLGDSLELHPITVLLSLIFWGMLWGIPGMLLAAPITAVLKILLESLEITKPVALLLQGVLPTQEEVLETSTEKDRLLKTDTENSLSEPIGTEENEEVLAE